MPFKDHDSTNRPSTVGELRRLLEEYKDIPDEAPIIVFTGESTDPADFIKVCDRRDGTEKKLGDAVCLWISFVVEGDEEELPGK